jgi:hypothetical protein
MKLFTLFLLTSLVAIASPNFIDYGFSSDLPESITWDLKQQSDDPKHNSIIRGYSSDGGNRSIALVIGKNTTNIDDLGKFTEGYKNQSVKIVSEVDDKIGGCPAKIITTEMSLTSGIYHSLSVVVLNQGRFYIITLSSIHGKVKDDELLMSYLSSIRISKT